jgi:hypothetical protein
MEPLSPERRRRRQMAFWKACLRPDNVPADHVVQKIFAHLQQAERVKQHQPSKRRAADHVERDMWQHLLTYLTTLECNDDVSLRRPSFD